MFHRFIQVKEKWARQLRQECLKETECASGWCRCETRFKFKIVKYRAKLSRCGCAEESGNAGGEERRGAWKKKRKEATLLQHQEIQPSWSDAHLPKFLKPHTRRDRWREAGDKRRCGWRCADEGLPLFVSCFCWAVPALVCSSASLFSL